MIELLLEHDTAGDPITGLKWSRRTTDKIAALLAETGIFVSSNTVARLLPHDIMPKWNYTIAPDDYAEALRS
jgi:hypothetical protein